MNHEKIFFPLVVFYFDFGRYLDRSIGRRLFYVRYRDYRGGPAALSAAVSARQRNKSVCIFGRSLDSSLLFAAEKVDNYLGLPDLSGEELLNQFYAHARKQGVEFVESRIKQIMPMGEYFVINADNNFVQAKTLILATGINKSRGIAGETEYLGKGSAIARPAMGCFIAVKMLWLWAKMRRGRQRQTSLRMSARA